MYKERIVSYGNMASHISLEVFENSWKNSIENSFFYTISMIGLNCKSCNKNSDFKKSKTKTEEMIANGNKS